MSVYHSISVGYVGDQSAMTLFINGRQHSGAVAWYRKVTVAVEINLMAIKCIDTVGFGGFLASVGYDCNVLVSDGHWKCSDRLSADERQQCYKLDFDNSHWYNLITGCS